MRFAFRVWQKGVCDDEILYFVVLWSPLAYFGFTVRPCLCIFMKCLFFKWHILTFGDVWRFLLHFRRKEICGMAFLFFPTDFFVFLLLQQKSDTKCRLPRASFRLAWRQYWYHGFNLTKRDDYFQVNLDPFWIECCFLKQQDQYCKLARD